MKILITGSAGNIGTQLSKYLTHRGHEVFGIDIVQGVGQNYKVVDINQPLDLFDVFDSFKPEVCYHLAAMVSRVTCEASPSITCQTNISGTANIIQVCRRFRTRLFFFSTSEIYGNKYHELNEWSTKPQPNNLYGLSKLIGEELVHYAAKSDLRAIIIRPFMFYHEDETLGDHRSAMIRFCTDLMLGKKITVHKGSGRSWMHLDDGCMVLANLLNVPYSTTINIGSPEYIETMDLAILICNKLGIDPSRHIIEEELPSQMTLRKVPNLYRMKELTGIDTMTVPLDKGIDRVISKLRSRL